ncbi:MAG: FAD-dependent oxidoreductase [Planctomycetes bacterium]|nr:FAD-dependent oxidoreductase [Planctomycetota bacterium]
METYREAARDVRVAGSYDVVVVGGGPAGAAAAIAASRNGAKTLVIEQFNCLGGVATAGGHGHVDMFTEQGSNRAVVRGIAHEIIERVVRAKFGIRYPKLSDFEVEGMKLILDQMTKEAGVHVLYHTFFCEAIVRDGTIVGAIIQNKTGRQAIFAKRVIDCTGDGDAAASAGCQYEQGRPGDGKCQPMTLMFTIGGVDWDKVEKFRGKNYALAHVWEQAQKNGDMEPFQKTVMGWWWTPTRPDQVGVNFTHITGLDSTKGEDLTAATIEARRQAYLTIDVYRKYVPGMENCYMISTPNTIGLRESRRIIGQYVLTEDDVKNQREFPDNICYGCCYIDIHCIDGPGMDRTTWNPPKGFKYHIPYRVLVPQKVENLLVAGRCASISHIALGSSRMMVQCMGMGEAAGIASAVSIKDGVTSRRVDVRKVQNLIRQQGGIISEEDIEKYDKSDPLK